MPLLSIIRFFAMLVSLAVLGATAYLLWTWYSGERLVEADGDVILVREDWRLWLGLALLAWSFLGKFLLPLVLARPDRELTKATRASGQSIRVVDGNDIYVEGHGPSDAPVIIFTHGWSLDSTIWFDARRDLGERFRVIVWDLPGLGRSKVSGRGAITLDSFAANLREIITNSANGKRVYLVGHSIGGMTIQTLARNDPAFVAQHVAGIVLLNTTYTNPLKTMILSGLMQAIRKPLLEPAMWLTMFVLPIAWLAAWQSYLSGWGHVANRFGFGKHVTRSQLEHVTLLTTKNSPANQARGNLAMFDWDATGALAHSPVPVLVIGGDMDIVTKPEASRVIAGSTPHGELMMVADVNHLGFLERAESYNSAIGEFVAKIETRP